MIRTRKSQSMAKLPSCGHRRRDPRTERNVHRRFGSPISNQYLFQMLAMPNIEMLDGMGVKKIITQCPHCFNTLQNEYPQLGGNYEVVHHAATRRTHRDGRLDYTGNA